MDIYDSLTTKAESLVGKTISSVRFMTPAEAADHGWTICPIVIYFDDGSMIYSSSDAEGNQAGALFGWNRDASTESDQVITLPAIKFGFRP